MRVAIAQLNSTVGDIQGNIEMVRDCLARVEAQQPDLLILPEMFITGYPLQDLLKKNWFIQRAEDGLNAVARLSERARCAIVIGGVARRGLNRGLFNGAFVFYQGKEVFWQAKSVFSDFFDEARYFEPAKEIKLWDFRGERIGISVGESAWNHNTVQCQAGKENEPFAFQVHQGATLLINIAASPFRLAGSNWRQRLIQQCCPSCHQPLIFVNQVGANDELIFDGNSLIVTADLKKGTRLKPFAEEIKIVELKELAHMPFEPCPDEEMAGLYDALVLGIRDYFRKCGFQKAVLGLSGGIDSAVVAALTVAALGRENVLGVTMPSQFSSAGSVEDSRTLARNLGIQILTIPISTLYHHYLETLNPFFGNRGPDETEENIQARIRSNILMAIANKFGGLVVATGNYSELAVGYCTLYGDLSGALAPIGDLPKTRVYELAQFINRSEEVIPIAIIKKPPSAELRPGQKDEDTLPPYPVLDKILKLYLEDGFDAEAIVEQGFAAETVKLVIGRLAKSEFKRQQAPLVLRVRGWADRFPIAARY